jgi:nucleotide-binding universal stress UspA family protein
VQPPRRSVLVGVTGPGENTEALRYALDEARGLDVGLTLVHAVHPMLTPPPPSVLLTTDDWADVGRRVTTGVRRELKELVAGDAVPVRTAVEHGDPRRVLAELSKDASTVVLQHRDLSRLHRIVTGSTTAAVATHAHCPVVSVPPSRNDRSAGRVISVGVHADGGPRPVLEAAFATAAVHHGSLRLVHAWRQPAAYDDILSNDTRWIPAAEATITSAAGELQGSYPDIRVAIEVRHDWPADVLVEAAERSELIIVGRHSGMPGLPARLGSLARSLIAHAPSPVMVIPL